MALSHRAESHRLWQLRLSSLPRALNPLARSYAGRQHEELERLQQVCMYGLAEDVEYLSRRRTI